MADRYQSSLHAHNNELPIASQSSKDQGDMYCRKARTGMSRLLRCLRTLHSDPLINGRHLGCLLESRKIQFSLCCPFRVSQGAGRCFPRPRTFPAEDRPSGRTRLFSRLLVGIALPNRRPHTILCGKNDGRLWRLESLGSVIRTLLIVILGYKQQPV